MINILPCFVNLTFDPPKLDYLRGEYYYTDDFEEPYTGDEIIELLRKSPPDFVEASNHDELWMKIIEVDDLVRLAPEVIGFSIKALSKPKHINGEYNTNYTIAEYCMYSWLYALCEHVDHENKKIGAKFIAEEDAICLYQQTVLVVRYLIEHKYFWDSFPELGPWKRVVAAENNDTLP